MTLGAPHAVSLLISHSFTLSGHTPGSILSAHCLKLSLTARAPAEFHRRSGDWKIVLGTHMRKRMEQANAPSGREWEAVCGSGNSYTAGS